MEGNERKTELYVGMFLLVGFLLLGTLIFQFGRFGEKFKGSYPLTLMVDDASGIIRGSDVRMGGAKIGKVASTPTLTDDAKVKIDLDIDRRIKIIKDSQFGISSASLIGDKMIVVNTAKSSDKGFIEEGSVIIGMGLTGIDAIQNNAEKVSADARTLMSDSATTLKKVDAAVDEVKSAAKNLSASLEKINKQMLSDENLAHINGVVKNLEDTSVEWKNSSNELEPLLKDARLALQNVQGAAVSAEKTFAKAGDRVDELQPAMKEIASAAKKAGSVVNQINPDKGLLGTLTKDESVSNDAKTFMKNLKERGILRYKDTDTPHPEYDPRNRFRGMRR